MKSDISMSKGTLGMNYACINVCRSLCVLYVCVQPVCVGVHTYCPCRAEGESSRRFWPGWPHCYETPQHWNSTARGVWCGYQVRPSSLCLCVNFSELIIHGLAVWPHVHASVCVWIEGWSFRAVVVVWYAGCVESWHLRTHTHSVCTKYSNFVGVSVQLV